MSTRVLAQLIDPQYALLIMRSPDFLVIGGMRCGTTSLFDLLRRQSGIYMPQKKELHYFDHRNSDLPDLAKYLEMFAPASEAQICGEITPDYLTTPGCDVAIHAVLPKIKLIAVLRDPVERAWSHYQFSRFHSVETHSFNKALDLEEQRLAEMTDHSDIFFSYQQRGRYVEHLRRFEVLFGKDQLHVLLLEELARNTSEVLVQLLEYLGCVADDESAIDVLPSLNSTDSYQAVGRSGWGARIQRRLSSFWPSNRIPLRARLRLRKYYLPYNKELSAWMGRQLPW